VAVPIHSSVWKASSANFALTEFYEVRELGSLRSLQSTGPTLEGRDGNDTLRVQAAGDELWGGPARDFVYGGPGGASVLADETLFGNVATSQAGNDVIYRGPGREEVDSQTGADDHGRLGHQPLTSRLPSSNRTSKVSTGSLAGPRSTSPLCTSNSEPWHGQITVLSCRSPSASEHCWWVQVSWKA
jgi:hypothetical protein